MREELIWTEEDVAAMRKAFASRFNEPQPRTESLFAVAAVGYRKALAAQAGPAGEPVAFVPVHPTHGPLWSDTFGAESAGDGRPSRYERRALYFAPPSQPVALPDEMPVPDPHTADDDCNCEQVGHARGWNACRSAMLAAAPAGEGVGDGS